ncbi:MAG: diguanylate cyclase [Desulfococcaceae bacterium]|jgi:diguanylate cyclase (GGDEF)-like protein|nr:diguanylate cyclase [Desulfococcaceae bacterium]
METVLIVEDSVFFGFVIQNKLREETRFEMQWVRSMSEAVAALDKTGNNFFAAILDFSLPDAPCGEIIDEVAGRGIPVIVFTSDLSEEVRELVWSKSVADYALKDDSQSLDYIVSMLSRIRKNPGIKILVVDDSVFFRKIISDLLRVHRYQVLNACNGIKALKIIDKHPDIKLVITDFSMPEMDGFTLTTKIRERYSKNELAIIGISSEGKNILAARFIKNGANDFIIKQSFLTEEFYSRVTQNIENLEHIQMLKDSSVKDFLTGLYNRRYFFNAGRKLFANATRDRRNLTCVMLDIDHFKKVNDTYGHEAGDAVLCHVSSILRNRMRETDIVARLGGEEFCILAVNMDKEYSAELFEELRGNIAASPTNIRGQIIPVTVSMGVTTEPADSLDLMVRNADGLLYRAKNSGRNKVIMGVQ